MSDAGGPRVPAKIALREKPSPDGEATLREVAEAAGVSRSTASRALRDHPRISQATIRRVRRIACELGYRRDAHLTELMVRLRQRKSKADRPIIAFILWQNLTFDPKVFQAGDTIFGGLWSRAWECGFQPEFFNIAQFENNRRRISQILRSRGIRAGILCPVEHPAPLPKIPWDQLSIVAVGYSVFSHHLHRCTPNHYQGMLDCIASLRRIGYRRIGAVLAHTVHNRTHGYYHAAYHLSRAAGEGEFAPLLVTSPTEGEEAFHAWLEANQPEAIICGGIIRPVRHWLTRRGLRIPKDIGLADLQVTKKEGYSGIWQNPFEIGAGAIDLLTTLLERNETGLPANPCTISLNGKWVEGTSTRHIPRRARE